MNPENAVDSGNATPVGALLLCRAEPSAVRPPAQLLRERQLLAPAGDGWSVLVPEGKPWREGDEPVDRVLGGWASAVSVATNRPALALWWDGERSGFTLASGFRRPVGYVWLTDGTPAGEDEAVHTFAARLGLDPVLDVQSLDPLTRPDSEADARARLLGLVAVLARTGLRLPPGLAPGEAGEALRAAARGAGAEPVEWAGWRDAVRAELHAVEEGLDHWLRDREADGARALGAAQLAAGVPAVLHGLRRRDAGWLTAGAVLLLNGGLALRPRTGRGR
ncbi:membrane protein [Streptomyces yaizuensis]|uniref:Membrane protein n=1 Tax=Streptomyces yaizuensis TaxID=2989713 RepID=A0ABQ5NW62_9ACTN|nr:membrane protein [Streptomyces sp. YSPA8]